MIGQGGWKEEEAVVDAEVRVVRSRVELSCTLMKAGELSQHSFKKY